MTRIIVALATLMIVGTEPCAGVTRASGERIVSFAADITVREDMSIEVREEFVILLLLKPSAFNIKQGNSGEARELSLKRLCGQISGTRSKKSARGAKRLCCQLWRRRASLER